MNTEVATRSLTDRTRASLRRGLALARAEAVLMRRSPMLLLNAVLTPGLLVLVSRQWMSAELPAELTAGASVVTPLVGFCLVFVVYYNLVTSVVARREDLVLKRLRTGELSDTEILTGVAVPAVATAWGQSLIGAAAAFAVFGMAAPTNVILVILAVVLGTAAFGTIALACTAFTRNVDLAQVTTMPVVLVSMVASGVWMPLEVLPDPLQRAAELLPLAPVIAVLNLGLTGTDSDGSGMSFGSSFSAAAPHLMVLAAWVVIGAVATRRWFRWEPRR